MGSVLLVQPVTPPPCIALYLVYRRCIICRFTPFSFAHICWFPCSRESSFFGVSSLKFSKSLSSGWNWPGCPLLWPRAMGVPALSCPFRAVSKLLSTYGVNQISQGSSGITPVVSPWAPWLAGNSRRARGLPLLVGTAVLSWDCARLARQNGAGILMFGNKFCGFFSPLVRSPHKRFARCPAEPRGGSCGYTNSKGRPHH